MSLTRLLTAANIVFITPMTPPMAMTTVTKPIANKNCRLVPVRLSKYSVSTWADKAAFLYCELKNSLSFRASFAPAVRTTTEVQLSLPNIGPTIARFVQISESNVDPADCSTPTTTHVRPPRGNVSPTSSRSRAGLSDEPRALSAASTRATPSPTTASIRAAPAGALFPTGPSAPPGPSAPLSAAAGSRTPADEIQSPPG